MTDNQGREISFGCATYDLNNIEDWYDKRICSVIRGQNGFAAVHYTICKDAVLAKLSFEVIPLSKSVIAVPVYNSVVVEAIIYAQNGKRLKKLKCKRTFSPAAEDQHEIARSTDAR